MESEKIHIILAYPNDNYDSRITKSIEICKKFPWIECHYLEKGESYEKLQKFSDKNLFEIAILPNHLGGILENMLPFYPNLKWVQAMGTGIDKLLECPDFIKRKDVVLTNLRSVSNCLLSEFAIFGCLYFCKNTRYYLDLMEKKEWVPKDYFGIETLEKKTALIIGAGSIGTAIAKKCKLAFNMKVLGIKREVSLEKTEYFDKIFVLEEMKNLISEADFVFNCLPTLKGVGKLYNEEIFKLMKKTAIFINIARGVIVDENALYKALKEDWIRGAALDVFEKEPLDKNHVFYNDDKVKEKVLISCHSMDKGPQYEEMMCYLLEQNLINYKEGKSLNGIINKYLGY